MSDWHCMWLYPPVDHSASDYNFEMPESIEAANIEGTLLVNAEDAIKQVRRLQDENARLRDTLAQYGLFSSIVGDPAEEFAKLRRDLHRHQGEHIKLREMVEALKIENDKLKRFAKLDEDTISVLNNCTDDLSVENEKLRESVRNLLDCIKHEECEESCPHYCPTYSDRGYESHGSTVVVEDYMGCCLVGLENCNSTFFDTDEYLREIGMA